MQLYHLSLSGLKNLVPGLKLEYLALKILVI